MPMFIAALIGALVQSAGTLVGRVLISLGFGYVTYTGIDTSITWAREFLLERISGLPATAVGIASTMQVGVCISILSSALVARMLLAGLTSDTLTKLVVK